MISNDRSTCKATASILRLHANLIPMYAHTYITHDMNYCTSSSVAFTLSQLYVALAFNAHAHTDTCSTASTCMLTCTKFNAGALCIVGRGTCNCSECHCEPGYSGASCQCSPPNEVCVEPGKVRVTLCTAHTFATLQVIST